MKNIKYKQIVRGTAEFSEMQDFANSFDHRIVPSDHVSLHALSDEGGVFGYSEIVFLPVTYPAFHPDKSSPRAILQVMHDWRAHTQLVGKPAYLGVPLEDGRPNFKNPVMEKLGLYQLKRELFTPY